MRELEVNTGVFRTSSSTDRSVWETQQACLWIVAGTGWNPISGTFQNLQAESGSFNPRGSQTTAKKDWSWFMIHFRVRSPGSV